MTPDQLRRLPQVLFDEAQLRRRVRELGAEIARDYRGRDPVLVSVLKGAIVFVADLMRASRLARLSSEPTALPISNSTCGRRRS